MNFEHAADRISSTLTLGLRTNFVGRADIVNFEWDPRKATRNVRKHGVPFHEAATIFGDPLAMTFEDPDHSIGERRFITVGMSHAGRLIIVAHADRGEAIRIISAREASRGERKHYEEAE